MASSDEGDFLGLEERMSFDEDVAQQEPLVQEELQGAQGGQDVALQGPPESLPVEEGQQEAEPPAPSAPLAQHVPQPEIPEADPWTFVRPMGTVDVRTKHPLTGEWVVPQDYDHVFDTKMDQFRRMTAEEVTAYRRGTYRPKEPRQASARDRRPRYSKARPVRGSDRNQPDLSSRAGSDNSNEPWRQDSVWKCAVKGWDHPGTNTILALEKHFMRWHQPQRVEYVCPFGGYRCPLQPCSAHNPELAMIRRHTKRHHCREAGWERASTELPYVVVDNPEIKDPGDLPRFPRDPRSGAPLRDWPFFLENAGPRWTTESVRVGWVPPNRARRAPIEPSQPTESNETVREEPPQEPPTRGSVGSQSQNVRPIHGHLQQEQRRTGAAAPTFPPPPPIRTSSSMSSPVDLVAQPRREVAPLQPSSSGPQRDFRREKREILEQRDRLKREFEAHMSVLDRAYEQVCMEEERAQIREERRALEAEKAWLRRQGYLGDQ